MESKINSGLIDSSSNSRRNDIFRRFREPFSILLTQARDRQRYPDIEKVYVEVDGAHDQVSLFLNEKRNQGQFLLGLTGIGKSTIIRSVFGIEKSKAEVKGDKLILPIFIDGAIVASINNIEERLGALFWNACEEMRRTFPELSYNDTELFEFIYQNSPQTLGRFDDSGVGNSDEIIAAMKDRSTRSFNLSLLKFYLQTAKINNVIIIIDDIDSIKDTELLSEFVHLAAKSWECLLNNDSGTFIKLLVAERQETHNNLLKEATWFKAFGFEAEPIVVNEPASIYDIFKKRFDFIMESKGGPSVNDIDEWNLAYGVLNDICHDLSLKNKNIMLSLCNYNIREAFSLLLELLTSGFWLQKSDILKPYFKLRKEQFRKPGNILILKAIGYKSNSVYINSKEQLLVNVLHNRRGGSYPLLPLQIVCSFHYRNEKKNSRYISVDKEKIRKKLKYVIPPKANSNLDEEIDYAFNYLLEKKILFISSQDVGQDNLLYLSPRGVIIWELLGKSSVLPQLYRDDVWMSQKENSFSSVHSMSPEKSFCELLRFIRAYVEYEHKLVTDLISASSLDVYKNLFGDSLPSIQLASGVTESTRRFYQIKRIDRPFEVEKCFCGLLDTVEMLTESYQKG